ncbi:MAG: purine-nucleoside phosphorylase [Clostridiales bacterium]|nr:purine-nucleoside phosphorylase [Clostridiales bacterium]
MIENKIIDNTGAAVNYILDCIKEGEDTPSICIVLGSGLSGLVDVCDIETSITYENIPGFPVSTVKGHQGQLIIGTLEGKRVFMMSGRTHYYEGYDTYECTFYIRVMAKLGVKTLYLTNAAGGIGEEMNPSELMIINDHLSFFCESPLRGPNLDEFGVRFPDQSSVYDEEYIEKLEAIADKEGIVIHKGIYAYSKGPQYETPAEIQALKSMGASAVGMSTVPEAIVASHCGIRIAAVSCITNLAAGISPNKLTHEEVMVNASKASSDSCKLARLFVKSL